MGALNSLNTMLIKDETKSRAEDHKTRSEEHKRKKDKDEERENKAERKEKDTLSIKEEI